MDLLIQLLITLMAGTAVSLLIFGLFRGGEALEVAENRQIALALGAGQRQTPFEQPMLVPLARIAMGIARRLGVPGLRGRIRQDLDAAGNPNAYSVDEYLAICILCAASLMTVATAITAMANPGAIVLLLPLMAILGFMGPLWSVAAQRTARLVRISKQLPYSLDLISLMLGAGSSFTEAIDTIIRDNPSDDLNAELRIVLAEIEFGTNRNTALRHLADRIPLDTLRSVVGAINQSEQLGSPLTSILKNQATMIRQQRSVRAEKLSASASLRLLLPGTLILLAVILCLFGPVVLKIMRDGLF